MPFSCVADPEQLAFLTVIVEVYCHENGIDPASDQREAVARLVLKLFCRALRLPTN